MHCDKELSRTESSSFTGGVARLSMLTLALVLGLTGTFSLSGCETTEGAGRDIENLGEGIQDTAD